MKMLKEVVILSLLAIVVLSILNIAAASSMNTSQPRSGSSGYHITISHINALPYPPLTGQPPTYTVAITRNFDVVGNITKDGEVISPPPPGRLYHGEIINNVPNPTLWVVKTFESEDGHLVNYTKKGDFMDTFQLHDAGRTDIIYTYIWGDGLADFCVSDVISVYGIREA